MKLIATIFLTLPCLAATVTSNAVTGNWSAGATWVGGVAPGNGDSAVIATGGHVTVDAATIVGTSGATGTTAITVQGTGQISVASLATLRVRGDISCPAQATATGCITGSGAGTIILDPSQAMSPSTTHYRIKAAAAGAWTFVNASNLTIQSDASGQRGLIDDSDQTQGGMVQCVGCYFHYLAIQPAPYPGITSKFSIAGSTFDDAYIAFGASCITNCSVSLSGNRWINNAAYNFQVSADGSQSKLLIVNNTSDQLFGQGPLGGGGGTLTAAVLLGNVFAGGFNVGGDVSLAEWNIFQLVGSQSGIAIGGCVINNGFLLTNHANSHVHMVDVTSTGTACGGYSAILTGNILETGINLSPSSITVDGFVEPVGANTATYLMRGNIVLCRPDGGGGNLDDMRGEDTSQYILDHNTGCTTNAALGMLSGEAELAADAPRGKATNNLAWAAAASTSYFINFSGDQAGPTSIPFTATDHNGLYNMTATLPSCGSCTNQANSCVAAWSATPCATGLVTGNPQFVDTTRSFETFDSAYLHNAPAAWNSSTAYTAGQQASSSNGAAYGGATINFRAIASSTNQQPGANWLGGSSWWSYWELGTLNSIRTAVNAGTTITDATIGCYGCSYPEAFIRWEWAGFAPQNAAFLGAASDGGAIGAVQVGNNGGARISGGFRTNGAIE